MSMDLDYFRGNKRSNAENDEDYVTWSVTLTAEEFQIIECLINANGLTREEFLNNSLKYKFLLRALASRRL